MNVGDYVIRKLDVEKNKKWPANLLNTPLQIHKVEGGRLYFKEGALFNPSGWVKSRFKKVEENFNPLAHFG